jgi:hypothetical protein
MKCKSLSASRDKSYEWCEFKYYLEYHLGIPQNKKFASEQGTFCHEIYEKLAKAHQKGIKRPKILKRWINLLVKAYRKKRKVTNRFGKEEIIPALWTLSPKALHREKTCDSCSYFTDGKCWVTGKDIKKFRGCPKDEFDDSIWLIEKVLNNETRLNPLNKKVLDVEKWFSLEIPSGGEIIRVNGLIDLVTELDHESIEIEDYKTGKWIQTYSDCLKDIQLLIYYLAVRELYPQYKYIFVTIHYIRRKSLTFAFGPEDEKKTRQKIIKRYYEIVNNQFPQRRCDRPNGFVSFDYVCKYMCDAKTCQKKYEEMVKQGHMSDAE